MRILSHFEICLSYQMVEDHLYGWQRCKTNYLHEAAWAAQEFPVHAARGSPAPGGAPWEEPTQEAGPSSSRTRATSNQLTLGSSGPGKHFQVRCQRAVLKGFFTRRESWGTDLGGSTATQPFELQIPESQGKSTCTKRECIRQGTVMAGPPRSKAVIQKPSLSIP